MYAHVSAHAMVWLQRLEDNLLELVFSFQLVGTWDQTQLVSLGAKHSSLPSCVPAKFQVLLILSYSAACDVKGLTDDDHAA